MLTPSYECFDRPLSKDDYKGALCLMYGQSLKNRSEFEKLREAFREVSFYVSTIDEMEVLQRHHKEEIFFELRGQETLAEDREYTLPRSLLDYPVQEGLLFYKLMVEWDANLHSTRERRKKADEKSAARKRNTSAGAGRKRDISSDSREEYSVPTYAAGWYVSKQKAARDFATAMRVAGVMILGAFLMYGCAISLAASGS